MFGKFANLSIVLAWCSREWF